MSAITPADPSKFNIQLVRFGAPSAYDALFQEAADRWASFISRDLPAYGALGKDWFLGAFCGEYTGPVDDVVVGYEVGYIDGRYGVLGRAGARYISGSRPFSGIMKFDAVDCEGRRQRLMQVLLASSRRARASFERSAHGVAFGPPRRQ